MKMGKNYYFDIDGVVCDSQEGNYELAVPRMDRIKKINKLFAKNYVIFYTARGTVTGIDWKNVTKAQFDKWGLKYDRIEFGKPFYDVLVDDRCMNDKVFFKDVDK